MALSSADSWIRQNPVVSVHFAGWETDTLSMAREGWELANQENFFEDEIRFIFRHSYYRLTAYGRLNRWRDIRFIRRGGTDQQYPPIVIETMGTTGNVLVGGDRNMFSDFRYVETRPTMFKMNETFRLDEIPLFTEKGVAPAEAQELIVNPEDVQMILDKVLAAQAPGMKEIRARENKRESREDRQVHAQIVTLRKVA